MRNVGIAKRLRDLSLKIVTLRLDLKRRTGVEPPNIFVTGS
jgi:hypothetical protein